MPLRLFSDKVLEFTIEGRPYMRGAPPGWQFMQKSERQEISKEAYRQIVKIAAKVAMCEQGWEEVDPNDPIYVVITINVTPIKQRKVYKSKEKAKYVPVTDKERIKNEMAVHEPTLSRITKLLMDALLGTVYKTRRQVVGFSVVKRYAPKEGIGILVGVARDWRTLNNDLRNA